MTTTARCSCGQLTATCTESPLRASVCHCEACQRRTGSAFGAQLRFAEAAVVLTGQASSYTRIAESGNTVTQHFCPMCGSTVTYNLSALPGFTAVPLGAFAGTPTPPPSVSIYEARALDWVTITGVEHHD